MAGNWRNVTGEVKIEATPDGRFHASLDNNEPVIGRWVCSIEGTGQVSNGVLEIGMEDGSKVRLSRDGQILNVEAIHPPNAPDWVPDYCGHNGTVTGAYFSTPVQK